MSDLFLGLFLNILASTLFIFILILLLKPKIKISHFICKNDGFIIKMVNKSFFTAYDIKVELCINVKTLSNDGMVSNNYRPISLTVNSVFQIPPYRPLFIRRTTPNAVRFRTYDKLDEILSEVDKSVIFMITAKHGFSGMPGVFSQEYFDVTEIKIGEFTSGNKFGFLVNNKSA